MRQPKPDEGAGGSAEQLTGCLAVLRHRHQPADHEGRQRRPTVVGLRPPGGRAQPRVARTRGASPHAAASLDRVRQHRNRRRKADALASQLLHRRHELGQRGSRLIARRAPADRARGGHDEPGGARPARCPTSAGRRPLRLAHGRSPRWTLTMPTGYASHAAACALPASSADSMPSSASSAAIARLPAGDLERGEVEHAVRSLELHAPTGGTPREGPRSTVAPRSTGRPTGTDDPRLPAAISRGVDRCASRRGASARSIKSGRGVPSSRHAVATVLAAIISSAGSSRLRAIASACSASSFPLPRLAAEDDRHPTAQLEDPTPQQFVVVGLRERLLEEPVAGAEVDRHPGGDRLGTDRARRQQGDQLVDVGERSRLVSGSGPMEDRHQPTAGTQRQVGGRGHPQAVVRQFSRQRRGTPPGRPRRGLTQLVGHRGIWLAHRTAQGDVPADRDRRPRRRDEHATPADRAGRAAPAPPTPTTDGKPQHQVVADDQETAGDRRLDRHHAVATPRPSQRLRGARSERRGDSSRPTAPLPALPRHAATPRSAVSPGSPRQADRRAARPNAPARWRASGCPPDSSWIRLSTGREIVSTTVRTTWRMPSKDSGPTTISSSRSGGSIRVPSNRPPGPCSTP